jgi:hypothetical protein
MKWIVGAAATAALIGLTASAATAAQTANHTVTVQVNAINELALTGGNVTLTISTATAGQQPDSATNSTCTLAWTTNQANRKITVATNLASPLFTLQVLAQSVSGGTAAPQVTLSTTAADFVTGVSKTVGTCTLGYTASATAAQGTGSDVHIVTYTLTAG